MLGPASPLQSALLHHFTTAAAGTGTFPSYTTNTVDVAAGSRASCGDGLWEGTAGDVISIHIPRLGRAVLATLSRPD